MAAQVTATFLPLAGLAQADVATGAAGRACAWASPDPPVFNPTVQFAVAHADPEETMRLKAVGIPTTTRRALRHMRRLSSSLSVVPLEAKGGD
jgi:hypothetical protein